MDLRMRYPDFKFLLLRAFHRMATCTLKLSDLLLAWSSVMLNKEVPPLLRSSVASCLKGWRGIVMLKVLKTPPIWVCAEPSGQQSTACLSERTSSQPLQKNILHFS